MKMNKQALVTEKTDLDKKISALKSQMDNQQGIEEMEYGRMCRQMSAMIEYSDLLADRIAHL